jgi:hypothetical protein
LNGHTQRAILSAILDQSSFIPEGIKEHVISTFSSQLRLGRAGRELWVQQRGQLMGQLVSFPLLCLVNYITFRYSFRGRRVPPVRVNGDDIVFRATPAEFAQWERDVAKGGLVLSRGKTLIHSRGFTLNSTPFWSSSSGVKMVGFVRSSSIWPNKPPREACESLGSRFYSSCSGYGRSRADCVKRLFLRENRRWVMATRRSLTRGMGLVVGEGVLKGSGLWDRELYYLAHIVEPELPAPISMGGRWTRVPRHSLTSSEASAWEALRQVSFVDERWETHDHFENNANYFGRLQAGCSPYGELPTRGWRMLGLRTKRGAFRLVRDCNRRLVTSLWQPSRYKEDSVWVLKDRVYPVNRKVDCPFPCLRSASISFDESGVADGGHFSEGADCSFVLHEGFSPSDQRSIVSRMINPIRRWCTRVSGVPPTVEDGEGQAEALLWCAAWRFQDFHAVAPPPGL